MPLLSRFSQRLRLWLRRDEVERELDDEIASFVEMRADENEARGVAAGEARRRVLAEMGGAERVKELVREERPGRALDDLARDVRHALRTIRREPGFALLTIGTLAVGIAASTAVFSVVEGVLLESLPYPDSGRIVSIGPTGRDGRRHFSPPDYLDFVESATSYDAVAALQGSDVVTLSVGGTPWPIRIQDVTPSFLEVYGVEPVIGRTFREEDDVYVSFEDQGNSDVTLPTGALMLSHELWQTRFGGEREAVGELVRIDLQPYEIVGVAPREFRTLMPGQSDYTREPEAWKVPRMDFRNMPRDAAFLRVIGRLRPGASVSAARAEASVFARRQRERHSLHEETGYDVRVATLHSVLTEGHTASLWILLGAVGLLLLVACANLANLLLARLASRRRELAVRLSLGSGRGRLVRQLVTETTLHASLGAVVAMPIAVGLVRLVAALAPASIPRVRDVGLDATALAFAAAAALASAALVALIPAARLSRQDEATVLRTAARATESSALWDRALVVIEVAMAVVLVVGTALVLRSLTNLHQVEPGFRADGVLTAEMNLASRRYPRYPRPDARVRFARQLTDAIERVPGVEGAALALVVPLSRQDAGHTYATEATAASERTFPPAKYRPVTPGYFRAAGTRLLAGRDFAWSDVENYRLVSIVDQRLAERAWPGESALGKRLRVESWSMEGGSLHLAELWTEVVGIAENVRSGGLSADDPETVYLPYGLYPVSELSLLARASGTGPPEALVSRIREEAARIDADLALFRFRTMDELVTQATASERFSLNLLSAFGASGLLLAIVGLYGVLSHLVSQRRQEFGIRLALGARPADVHRSVIARGARWVAAGIALGLVGSAAASRLLASQLYEMSPTDPSVYALVALGTLGVGLVACCVPARRAARSDPMRSLRLE